MPKKLTAAVLCLALAAGCNLMNIPKLETQEVQAMTDVELVAQYRLMKDKAQQLMDTANHTMSQQPYSYAPGSQLGHSIGQALVMAKLRGQAENLKASAEKVKAECLKRNINPETYPQ